MKSFNFMNRCKFSIRWSEKWESIQKGKRTQTRAGSGSVETLSFCSSSGLIASSTWSGFSPLSNL